MKQIKLTKGKVALVDDEDYERLAQFKWFACKAKKNRTFYAARWMFMPDGKRVFWLMHRFIMNVSPDGMVDHADGNGLNNQRYNIRPCSNAENQYNKATPSNNTSGYKGVSYFRRTGKWRVSIQHEGERHHLGYFDTAEEAARVYDDAAIRLHSPFARLNFKKEG